MSYPVPTMERKEYIVQDCQEYLAKVIVEKVGSLEIPFLHLEFRKWSPSSFKKLLRAWRLFRWCHTGTFYALANHDDEEKHRKFVQKLGFEYFRHLRCPDGKERPCYFSQE